MRKFNNRIIPTSGRDYGMSAVNRSGAVRTSDRWGYGHFGAPRGKRLHQGVDYLIQPNQSIFAPFDCRIVRYGYVSARKEYRLVKIEGIHSWQGYVCKIMYIHEKFPKGLIISKGHIICTAADLTTKYKGIKNHVHVELWKNGRLVNPTFYI